MGLLISNARLVVGHRILDDGWISISGGHIEDFGTGPRPGGIDMNGLLVSPGFIDMHVHGAVGHSFGETDHEATTKIIEYHRLNGTTTALAGIATDLLPNMRLAAASIADTGLENLEGIFFEGPFLSLERKGAHDPAELRTPNSEELQSLLEAGAGHVRLVTIAPELSGGLDAIRQVRAAGAAVAVGHTDASYEVAKAGFDAGATVATHLFNGMRPIHHRDPGVVVAAMEDERVTCELITDGYHLDDAMIGHVFRSVGAGRIALITDAIEATGVGDGEYHRGTTTTIVSNGLAMLADGSSIAGSTLTMSRAVKRTVRNGCVSITDAITAASATPARTLGIADRVGRIAPGLRADLVVLNVDLSIAAVMSHGTWVSGPWPQPSCQ